MILCEIHCDRFDEEMIESLFGYNMQSSMKNDEGKSKSPPPSKQLLDPKRLQNMTILAKALNVTAEQVCDALLQGNTPNTLWHYCYYNGFSSALREFIGSRRQNN